MTDEKLSTSIPSSKELTEDVKLKVPEIAEIRLKELEKSSL